MYSLAALVSFSLIVTTFVPGPTPVAHEPSVVVHSTEAPPSILALVFDAGGEAPSQAAAMSAIVDSKPSESSDGSELWGLAAPEGLYMLSEMIFDDDAASALLENDQARFTPPEIKRLPGERLTFSLFTELGDGGLPRLHKQIKELAAAAKAIGLEDPIALYDVSAERWHPPGWIARMVESEAGPAPSTTFHSHGVYDDDENGEKRIWIHSHGVARLSGYEVGCVDVRPEHYDALSSVVDAAAGIAVDDIDWPAKEPTQVLYGLELARLPWKEGVKALAPSVAGTADDHDEDHEATFVLAVQKDGEWGCPGKAATALERIVAARSTRETERGALAARETYQAMRTWQRSTDIFHQVLVKSPVETEEDGHEHCWFEATRLRRSSVKATLVSQPMGVAAIAPGDPATLKVTDLTGWMVQTEEGNFGPDELEALLVASSAAAEKE